MKTALITGANRGIGRVISIALANLGYQTILFGRDKLKLIPLVEQIKDECSQCIEPDIFACDLSNESEVQKCLEDVIDNYDRIDVLVNNAGIYHSGSIENEVNDFNEMLRINLIAPFQIMKSIAPIMIRQRSGYIFNVASRAGKIGFEGSGIYAASKFGFVGLSESLYRELSKAGIKVTALCPGWVNTDMAIHDANAPIEGQEMIQPEDLARSIEYLLSLSKYTVIKELVIECSNSIA